MNQLTSSNMSAFNFRRTGLMVLVLSVLILAWSTKPVIHEGVKVSGRQILVDGNPYIIRGVCYNPVPKGSDKRDFSSLKTDLNLMVEAGINTIRVYSPIDDKAVLDEIESSGIKIIMGFGYDQNGDHDIRSGSYIEYVRKYKDHGAILIWELGNEYNYHPEWFDGSLGNWYEALNEAAAAIHKEDSVHPVSTAHGELPDAEALRSCPEIDIWGMNVYRWDRPGEIFSEWKAVSDKPMYLSEAGADSYMTTSRDDYAEGVNERAQADANANILGSVFKNTDVCSGVTLFAFSDEWWKAGDDDNQDKGGWAPNSTGVPYDGTPNEEYWGIVDIDRNKKQTFNTVKMIYKQNNGSE